MNDKSFEWGIIFALSFILVNCFFYGKHQDKVNEILKMINKQVALEERQNQFEGKLGLLENQIETLHIQALKYKVIKSFLADTGMADAEWLNKN